MSILIGVIFLVAGCASPKPILVPPASAPVVASTPAPEPAAVEVSAYFPPGRWVSPKELPREHSLPTLLQKLSQWTGKPAALAADVPPAFQSTTFTVRAFESCSLPVVLAGVQSALESQGLELSAHSEGLLIHHVRPLPGREKLTTVIYPFPQRKNTGALVHTIAREIKNNTELSARYVLSDLDAAVIVTGPRADLPQARKLTEEVIRITKSFN